MRRSFSCAEREGRDAIARPPLHRDERGRGPDPLALVDFGSGAPPYAWSTSLDFIEAELERLQKDLTRALRRACPAWLDSRRDDLVQAAMLRVLSVKRREENAVLSSSYLYKVAYAVVVDEMRRAQWRRETSLESDGPSEAPAAAAGAGPEQMAAAGEIAEGIHDCLSRLDAPRSLAVTLHLQGYSLAEAAQTLDWSLKRTENLTYRGLADLRACLAAKGLKP